MVDRRCPQLLVVAVAASILVLHKPDYAVLDELEAKQHHKHHNEVSKSDGGGLVFEEQAVHSARNCCVGACNAALDVEHDVQKPKVELEVLEPVDERPPEAADLHVVVGHKQHGLRHRNN